ncbi:MAG: HAAS signaling domain-containing protein [Candidatus Heteroscillospira sp.]
MKEKYIRLVKRELLLRGERKQEVLRDLGEAFDSALEHGETVQQLIERLGSPAEYAAGIHEQLGIDAPARRKRKKQLQISLSVFAAAAFFLLSALIDAARVPQNVIGGACAMTEIELVGSGIDPAVLLMALGSASVAVTVILAIQYFRKK